MDYSNSLSNSSFDDAMSKLAKQNEILEQVNNLIFRCHSICNELNSLSLYEKTSQKLSKDFRKQFKSLLKETISILPSKENPKTRFKSTLSNIKDLTYRQIAMGISLIFIELHGSLILPSNDDLLNRADDIIDLMKRYTELMENIKDHLANDD